MEECFVFLRFTEDKTLLFILKCLNYPTISKGSWCAADVEYNNKSFFVLGAVAVLSLPLEIQGLEPHILFFST